MGIRIILSVLLMVMTSACGNMVKVVTEKLQFETPPPKDDVGIKALDDYGTLLDTKLDALLTLRDNTKQQANNIAALFATIDGIDLDNPDSNPNVDESRTLQQFVTGAHALVSANPIQQAQNLSRELDEVIDEAKGAKAKLSMSDAKSSIFPESTDEYRSTALAHQEEIKNATEKVTKKLDDIKQKIDGALTNYQGYFGDEINRLERLIQKARTADSLGEIDAILNDARFYDLVEKVKNSIHGPRFFNQFGVVQNLLLGDGLATRSVVEKAIQLKDDIDNRLTSPVATQDEVIRLARSLDRDLNNDTLELENYANTAGIIPAEVMRKDEVQRLVALTPTAPAPVIAVPPPAVGGGGGPPPPPGPPPPVIGGAAAEESPIAAMNTFKDLVQKISSPLPKSALTIFERAGAKVAPFFDHAKLQQIINAAKAASDPASYIPDYNKIIDALKPYKFSSLLEVLQEGDVVSLDDEEKLAKNFETMLKRVNKDLAGQLRRARDERVQLLVTDWKTEFNGHPTTINVVRLADEIVRIKFVSADPPLVLAIRTKCDDLQVYLALDLDCKTIADGFANTLVELALLPEVDLPAGPRNTKRGNALSVAKNSIQQKISPIDDVARAKTKSEFTEALANFNALLKPPHKITLMNNMNIYDVPELIKVITQKLRTYAYDGLTYEAVLNEYQSYIFPTMSAAEINDLKDKFGKIPVDVLERHLKTMLSAKDFNELTRYFRAIPNVELVKNLKAAALANHKHPISGVIAGIPAFEEAYQKVLDSFDDASSSAAITHFATFFKNNPAYVNGKTLKADLLAIAVKPGLSPTFDEQRLIIKNRVDGEIPVGGLPGGVTTAPINPRYKNLKAIADIIPADLANTPIENQPTSLASLARGLTPAMRNSIFDHDAAGTMRLVDEFNRLKEYLITALNYEKLAIAPSTPTLEKDRETISPMVNAFKLLFLHPLTELNRLTFNGTDDDAMRAILATMSGSFFGAYIHKFKKFRSVVGELEIMGRKAIGPPGPRQIMFVLRALELKLKAAISGAPEINVLKSMVKEITK